MNHQPEPRETRETQRDRDQHGENDVATRKGNSSI
jgi:hypothetical protein